MVPICLEAFYTKWIRIEEKTIKRMTSTLTNSCFTWIPKGEKTGFSGKNQKTQISPQHFRWVDMLHSYQKLSNSEGVGCIFQKLCPFWCGMTLILILHVRFKSNFSPEKCFVTSLLSCHCIFSETDKQVEKFVSESLLLNEHACCYYWEKQQSWDNAFINFIALKWIRKFFSTLCPET